MDPLKLNADDETAKDEATTGASATGEGEKSQDTNTDPSEGETPETVKVGDETVDADKYFEAIVSGATRENAIKASRIEDGAGASAPEGDDAEEASEDGEEGSAEESDDDDSEGGEEESESALAQEEADRVSNLLRRDGWPQERIDALLSGDANDVAFAVDQANRFAQTQEYIERNVRGRSAEDADETQDDTSDPTEDDADPPQADVTSGRSGEVFEALKAEFGEDSAAAVQRALDQSSVAASERSRSEMRAELGPFAELLSHFIRREVGEEFPELLESEAAWKRTAARAEAIGTTQDGTVFDHLKAAAAELKYQRKEATRKKAERRKAAADGEPLTTTNVGAVEPATSEDAYERYIDATMNGHKADAAKFLKLHNRLEKAGK